MEKWYYNAKTGEIDSYNECGELTDFPRGVWLAYGDYLTTGFKSRAEAIQWSNEWGACLKCKSARFSHGGQCAFCESDIILHKVGE